MAAPYVPLRIFSCYTMLEGAIEPKAIAKQAKKLDLPAAALTDRNGLYAAMAPLWALRPRLGTTAPSLFHNFRPLIRGRP